MSKRLGFACLAVLALSAPGCLGGQTGQPTSGSCEPRAQPVGAEWRGRTTRQLAEAFNGEHRASLRWIEEPRDSGPMTPVAFDDAVTIALHYEGGMGMLVDCAQGIDVPVRVQITTSESSLSERGIGTLSFAEAGAVLHAQLAFEGAMLSLDASLTQSDAGEPPQGQLEPLDAGAPGAWARFP